MLVVVQCGVMASQRVSVGKPVSGSHPPAPACGRCLGCETRGTPTRSGGWPTRNFFVVIVERLDVLVLLHGGEAGISHADLVAQIYVWPAASSGANSPPAPSWLCEATGQQDHFSGAHLRMMTPADVTAFLDPVAIW